MKADNLTAFSLLLAPAIAPAGKPIEVKVNGKRSSAACRRARC